MSRRIAGILGEPEPQVAKLLKELEDMNGYPSHDARFLAENIQQVRAKISDLGLDPDDTTGKELYHALLVKFEKNSRLFDIHFGTEAAGFDARAAKAVQLIRENTELPQQWALKNPAAKQVLRQLPPKHLMKHLGYRSPESLLKREKPAELYIAAKYLESATWQKAHARLISRLAQSNFELRPLQLIPLSSQRWGVIQGPQDSVAYNYDVGVIALWPSDRLDKAGLLSITLLLFEALQAHDINVSESIASLSGVLQWWADMDHLIAELSDEHVSLSLRDCALNSLEDKSYEQRELEQGRQSFWKELLGRYENRPPAEALFDGSAMKRLGRLRFAIPEPAYEFAEEFDG